MILLVLNLHAVIVTETMKGYKKRKTTFFKPGYIPHNKGVRYLTDDTLPTSSAASVPVTRKMDADKFSLMTKTKPTNGDLQSVQAQDCNGTPGSANIPRPSYKAKLDLKETELNEHDGTHIICMKKKMLRCGMTSFIAMVIKLTNVADQSSKLLMKENGDLLGSIL